MLHLWNTKRIRLPPLLLLAPLLRLWLKKKTQERPEHYTDEYIVIWRDEFIEDNWAELYDHTVTICHAHHRVAKIYGRNPGLGTATKQMRWVDIQEKAWHGIIFGKSPRT